MSRNMELVDCCAAIADQVEPRYRTMGRSYACTGTVGKHWTAAFEGARLALTNPMPKIIRASGTGHTGMMVGDQWHTSASPQRKCMVCGAVGDADHAAHCSDSW